MMRLMLNLVLALLWCMLSGSAHPWNFVVGLGVGALVVSASTRGRGASPYLRGLWRVFGFARYFVVILVKANLQIAREVLTPGLDQSPRVLRYPVGGLTDAQRTTLSNAITLTPGTLVVDVCPSGEWLYIHCMFAEDPEAQIAELRELENRLVQGVFS